MIERISNRVQIINYLFTYLWMLVLPLCSYPFKRSDTLFVCGTHTSFNFTWNTCFKRAHIHVRCVQLSRNESMSALCYWCILLDHPITASSYETRPMASFVNILLSYLAYFIRYYWHIISCCTSNIFRTYNEYTRTNMIYIIHRVYCLLHWRIIRNDSWIRNSNWSIDFPTKSSSHNKSFFVKIIKSFLSVIILYIHDYITFENLHFYLAVSSLFAYVINLRNYSLKQNSYTKGCDD